MNTRISDQQRDKRESGRKATFRKTEEEYVSDVNRPSIDKQEYEKRKEAEKKEQAAKDAKTRKERGIVIAPYDNWQR